MKQTAIWITGGLFWCATAVGAYYLGHGTGESDAITRAAGGSGSNSNYSSSGKLRADGSRAMSGADAASLEKGNSLKITGGSPGGNGIESLANALKNDDPVARMAALSNALLNLNASNIGEVLKAFESLPEGDSRSRELAMLMHSWAAFDGTAALTYLKENHKGRSAWSAYGTALSSWARNDADGAIQWAMENNKPREDGRGGNDNWYLVGVVRGIAKNDLPRAGQTLEMMEFGRARGEAMRSVAEAYLEADPAMARSWAAGIEDERLRAGTIGMIADRLADSDLQGTINWVEELPDGDGRERAVAEVASTWSQENPREAAEWVTGFTDPEVRQYGFERVAQQWAREDMEGAAQWLDQFEPSPEMDSAYGALAREMGNENPESAMAWVNNISNEDRRSEMYLRVGWQWMQRDGESARQWLDTNSGNLPESVIQRLTSSRERRQ